MEAPDGLPPPQRGWAMFAIGLAIAMAVLDGAIAHVALPTIARDLAATPADSVWVVNAYQLVITILLLPLASAGEIVGYRRVYRIGLAVFTLASLACALSDSLLALTLARVAQGVGAAGVMSVNAALVRFIYPRRLLGRGIGVVALVVAVSAAVGPTVASAILSIASWPWLFAVNVPIGIATLVAAQALPRTPGAPRRFDLPSAVLNALFFGLLIVAIDSANSGMRSRSTGSSGEDCGNWRTTSAMPEAAAPRWPSCGRSVIGRAKCWFCSCSAPWPEALSGRPLAAPSA